MRLSNLLTSMAFFVATLVTGAPSFAENESSSSFYTPLDQCKILTEIKEEAHYFKEKCPGREGYSVYIEGQDDRSWLILKKGTREINLEKESFKGPLFFISIDGKALEWRYRTAGGKKTWNALIYRISGTEPSDPMKARSLLYVVRLEPKKWCILGNVSSNEEAHALTDSDRKCP